MSKIQQFIDGDIVYTYYGGAVFKGQVYYDEKYHNGMRLDILCDVQNGKECVPPSFSPKELYVSKDDLHLSAEEALEAGLKEKARKTEEIIQGYCDSIVTLEDLINFSLTHCLDEKRRDFDEYARTAYLRRSQELLKNVTICDS